MKKGKSKAVKKQNVGECSDTGVSHDIESQEDPPTVYREGEEEEAAVAEEEEGGKRKLDTGRQGSINEKSAENGTVEEDASQSSASADEGEENEEVWDIIRVIPTAQETIKCRYPNCSEQAVAIWATDKNPKDKWPLCEKCQLEDFGGWPEGVDPIEREEDANVVVARNDRAKNDDAGIESTQTIPVATTPCKTTTDVSNDGKCVSFQSPSGEFDIPNDESDPTPSEEKYELTGIVPLEKLLRSPIKCSQEDCNLPACSVWTSTTDPKKWYYCIDCQERDFDGWPPSKELPCDYLQPEHFRAIATKCSRKRKPTMPVLTSACVTPPPNSSLLPKGNASASQVVSGGKKAPIPKISQAAVARHEKWQADAKKLGVNRIIVKKIEAKKVVFDALYDEFRPMSLDNIYKMLKKMIPPPVLKAALGEMSMDWQDDDIFEASDDDENNKTEGIVKKKGSANKEPYAGSLFFKAGKSAASSLYYVDHNKIKEMSFEEKRELAERLANARAEHEHLGLVLKKTDTMTNQLLIEPTNDDLLERLSDLEKDVAVLAEKVNDARALTINESHKNQLKRKIQSMAGHYRKRKQLCCSFLSSLEEMSDGTISKKKCLKGEGQIALDSDESINKAAIAYAKSKKRSKTNKVSLADKNFVGVVLDSQQMIKRVYAHKNE